LVRPARCTVESPPLGSLHPSSTALSLARASGHTAGPNSWVQMEYPRGCAIFVHDVTAATGLRLHERYTPCGWPHVQHADEAWLTRALTRSAWRVSRPEKADFIYLDGHEFSRWCTASRILAMHNSAQRLFAANVTHETACPGSTTSDQRPAMTAEHVLRQRLKGHSSEPTALHPTPIMRDERSKRKLWQLMMATSSALSSARRIPRVVALTSNECPPPFRDQPVEYWGGPHTEDVLLLVDQRPRELDAITPYVVSQPPWLAGVAGSSPPPTPRWEDRKLLFIAGHTPKLTQSATRYLLWKQLRRCPHVTVMSSTIGCNIAAYEICNSPERLEEEYSNFCNPWCRSRIMCTGSASLLRRQCRLVRSLVNYSDEQADLKAAHEQDRLPHGTYLSLARSHRFCLVAPGDFVSTHKITEVMAIGGSGGCIPVYVLARSTPGGRGMLPYTRWLDYCSVAYVVHEKTARRDAAAVVRALLAVGAAEAEAKLKALARVRDAFVFREGSSQEQPSAAEYILDEACASARRFSASVGSHQNIGSRGSRTVGVQAPWIRNYPARTTPDLSRCMLVTPATNDKSRFSTE